MKKFLFSTIIYLILFASTINGANKLDILEKRLKTLLEQKVAEKLFPGASVAIFYKGQEVFINVGYTDYKNEIPVTENTIYDLASLTKVLATTNAIMKLIEDGKLSLDDKISKFFDDLNDEHSNFAKATLDKKDITILSLLTHTSGFYPCYFDYDNKSTILNLPNSEQKAYLANHSNIKSKYQQDEKYCYSDIDFILLGQIVEKVSGEPLDQFCETNLYKSVGLDRTLFNPLKKFDKTEIAPTEEDVTWRKRTVHGTVHDEKAEMLQGIAGHAGLFSCSKDLLRFMRLLMESDNIITQSSFEILMQQYKGFATRIGWQKDCVVTSLHGNESFAFSDKSFGALGFTGTTIWADASADKKFIMIALTNYIHPSRANGAAMLQFRRELAKIISEAMQD